MATLKELRAMLQSDSVTDRRSAALTVREVVAKKGLSKSLRKTLQQTLRDDSDAAVKRDVALAILSDGLHFDELNAALDVLGPLLEADATAGDGTQLSAVVAAASRDDIYSVAAALYKILLRVTPDVRAPKVRSRALAAIKRSIQLGCPPQPAVFLARSGLGQPAGGVSVMAASLLETCRAAGAVIGDPERSMAMVTEDDPVAQLKTAKLLAAERLDTHDLSGLSALLRHDSAAVREGASEAVAEAGEALIPAFRTGADALDGNTGAVVFNCLRALKHAAKVDRDVSPALEVLRSFLSIPVYERDGFSLGLYPDEAADLGMERPDYDAAEALAAHYLRLGETEAVASLLNDDRPHVISGALEVVQESLAHADPSRRRNAARLAVLSYSNLSAWHGIEELMDRSDESVVEGARTGVSDLLGGDLSDEVRQRLKNLL